MSANKFVTFEIGCDLRVADACAEVYTALPGLSLRQARTDAANEGWKRGRSVLLANKMQDICPECSKRLAGVQP